MPSSRVRREVCGIDDVVLRLRDGDMMVSRAHFGPVAHCPSRSVLMQPEYRWVRRAWHAPYSRRPARRMISQCWVLRAGARTFLVVPLRQRETHWNDGRTSHRRAPLHPGADQTARNLRRSGRDRHRERAAVPKLTRRWSSKQRRAKSWASSPARRRIFSRCWILLPRLLRGYVMRRML